MQKCDIIYHILNAFTDNSKCFILTSEIRYLVYGISLLWENFHWY